MERESGTAGHTPGPWWAGPVGNIEGQPRTQIMSARGWTADVIAGDNAEAEANARLIAAAPAMLEALREVGRAMFTDGYAVMQLSRETAALVEAALVSASGVGTGRGEFATGEGEQA